MANRALTLSSVETRVTAIVNNGAHDFRETVEDGYHWCLWYEFEMVSLGEYDPWSLDTIKKFFFVLRPW